MPRVAERVLQKIESVSALTKNDHANIPLDIIQAIVRALYLSREERKAMLPYFGQEVEVTISVIRLYITNRFRQYETIANVCGPPSRPGTRRCPTWMALKLLLVLPL